jgi:hypothetical protein
MTVPMRPRPMNPTGPRFAGRMPTPFADAASTGLACSSFAPLTMSVPLQEKSPETSQTAPDGPRRSVYLLQTCSEDCGRHFSCFAVFGLFLRRTSFGWLTTFREGHSVR